MKPFLTLVLAVGVLIAQPRVVTGAPITTGEVTLSAIEVLRSEIERIDLTPGSPEHAAAVAAGLSKEELAAYRSINYRIKLVVIGIERTIWSERTFSIDAPPSTGPAFNLRDGWLSKDLCLLLIEDAGRAIARVLVKQADGSWSTSDVKQVTVGPATPCSIRKTAPPAIVQEYHTQGVPFFVDRFRLSGRHLILPP
jgi:hypothetical protein